MKKILKGIIVISSLLLLAGCNEEVHKEEPKKDIFKVDYTEGQVARNYYVVNDDTIIYTDYNSIKYEGKELNELLTNKEVNIYDLIKKAELVAEANDGGSKIYKDGEVYISNCNSLEENGNNHNIYITKDKSYALRMCSFNITKLEKCLNTALNSYLTTKKEKSKNGKIKDIYSSANYEKITYKKSSQGEYIIVKTNDEKTISSIKKYFKKKNKNYYYSSYAVYLDEVYHIFFYNKKNSKVESKLEKCINESWNIAAE